MDIIELIVEESGERIDKYLSTHTELSRSRCQTLVNDGNVLVDGEPVKRSYKVSEGEEIEVSVPENQPLDVKAENIPLDIIYEDSDIIVINKPKGMVVHPAFGSRDGTLVNALMYHCKDLSGINGVLRPGIVHRIDKDTTGCIVACKNDAAHTFIAKQLSDKTCHREYKAIVMGNIPHDAGVIDAPLGRDKRDRQRMTVTENNSRNAITHFRVEERFGNATLVDCELETGRTHQIRAHMKYINHPIMGDEKYGRPCPYMDTHGQVLHAYRLTLVHPTTKKEMVFEAPLPPYFEELIEILKKED